MLGSPLDLLTREVLRDRARTLVAESCAWAVGLSDRPHYARRGGRVVATGATLGLRAAAGQRMSDDDDEGWFQLGDARAGTFADALNAVTADGGVWADRYDDEVLAPFVLDSCVVAAERARKQLPDAWAELLEDTGEDGSDLVDVVRAAEWETPLRTEAEQLALAALGDLPLLEVEDEGLPLSVVRAAEAQARSAAPVEVPDVAVDDDALAGALFLAQRVVEELPSPVPPSHAGALLEALTSSGIEPEEVLALLPHLPVTPDAAQEVAALLDR